MNSNTITMEKILGGKSVQVNEEGFLTDLAQWSREVADSIAEEYEIHLSPLHWQVIDYLQREYRNDVPLTIRKVGKSGVVDIKQFYSLFPPAPLKVAAKISGIPKPASCI